MGGGFWHAAGREAPLSEPATDSNEGASDYDGAVAHFLDEKTSPINAATLLVLSGALFAVGGFASLSPMNVALIMGVLLLHELGHAGVMRLFGYRDLKVFFLPFLGAAASGRAQGVGAWKRALVLLAGPVPGIVVGWAAGIFVGVVGIEQPMLNEAIGLLIVINAFNLLPFVPLDGGRLLMILFAGRPTLEAAFGISSAWGLAMFVLWQGLWLLGGLALLVAVGVAFRHRIVRAAHDLRPALAGASVEPAGLTPAQLRVLFDASCSLMVSPEIGQEPEPEARQALLARHMRQLHERAVTAPPTLLETAGILVAYGAALALVAPLVVLLLR